MGYKVSAICRALAAVLSIVIFSAVAFSQAPQISLPLVPSSVTPGSVPLTTAGLTITVNGIGFNTGSTVNWNGSPRPTTFVSATRLKALVSAEDVESPGTAWVTVTAPGVPTSNVAYFEVTNPALAVSFSSNATAVDQGPISVAVGDFNGDGRVDFAVADYLSGDVSVVLGNGDGTFQSPLNYGLGNGPVSLAAADVNGDGKLDLVATNTWDNNVSVLLGNGDGSFQAAVNYPLPNRPLSITVGDFNRDGKLDLAVANMCGSTPWPSCSYLTPGSISILLGNGDGTFQPPLNYAVMPWPGSVAVGDLNGDGKLDLAVGIGAQTNSVSVLLGNGDGTFRSPTNYTVTGVGGVAAGGFVALGDLNGDSKLDVVVANGISGTVSVLLGNGDGTLQTPTSYTLGLPNSFEVSPSPGSVELADINGDGKPDLLVGNAGGTNVTVFLGNGDGSFQAPLNTTVSGSTNSQGGSVAFADLNGDGRMDVALAGPGSALFVLMQPTPSSGLAQLNGGNNFTGNQTIAGTVTATNFVGNGSGLTGVIASGIACAGCVGNSELGIVYAAGDTQGGNALNALALSGLPASAFAPAMGSPFYAPATGSGAYVAKAGDTMTGTLNLPANGLAAGGNQFVLQGGNVGIGTATPEAISQYTSLHIDHAAGGFGGSFLELTHSATGAKGRLVMDDNGFLLAVLNSEPIKIKAGNFNGGADPGHIFVSTTGNVGIRTGSPGAALDVNGTANFSGLVTFAPGQTFPGAGNGTITGVTAGTGLSGGGTSGNVNLTNTGILSLSAGTGINISAGQTPTLSLNTSFTDGRYAQLTAANTFTANQTVPNLTVSGTVSSSLGNFSANSNNTSILNITQGGTAAGLTSSAINSAGAAVSGMGGYFGLYGYGIEAGVKGESNLNFGVVGTSVSNAAVYGIGGPYGVVGQGNTAGIWAQGTAGATGLLASNISSTGTAGTFNVANGAKILSGQSSNSEVFSVASDGSVATSGKLTTTGSLTIGSGTPIVRHVSALFSNLAFNLKLTPTTCTTWSGTLSPASDGDTVAVGMSSSLMSANIVYSAWATNGGITVRICNPTGAPTTVGSGNIRVDVWKH